MIILDTTTLSLQIKLAGAITTNQLPFVASWVDVTTTTFVPGNTSGATNSGTAVTVAAAPASSTERQIKFLSVQNADTVAATVTVILNNNSTLRNICVIALNANDTLVYTDGEGFRVIDTNGQIKMTGISNSTSNTITDDTSTNATMYPAWVTAATGNLPIKVSSTKITFNPSTANLTTTTFTGALSGNATTATSATSATTATNATNTAITDDTSTNATMYPTWVTATSGNLPQKVSSTKITFNPSTANLTTTTFTGALAGNSTTATALATPRAIYGNNFDGSAALAQIIASTFGGTGNGFTKFSGATTSEKTFTLPNASATVLTDNALVTVAQGGSGAGTLTGILKGNGTSAFTAVTAPTGTIVGTSDTQTLTNKRVTNRVLALSANSATPAINTDSYDVVHITSQSTAITSFTTNLTGTPVDGDTLRISVTGSTAIALTFGTSFEASGGQALSTTTVTTARLDMGFLWNSETSKWRQVAQA